MIRVNCNKKSKFIVYVGWGLQLFADNYNDVTNVIRQYGNEKCSFKAL